MIPIDSVRCACIVGGPDEVSLFGPLCELHGYTPCVQEAFRKITAAMAIPPYIPPSGLFGTA